MCAYKPPSITNQSLNGMARIMLNKAKPNTVKVVLSRKVQGEEVTSEHFIERAKCPKWIKSGQWRVRLNAAGTEMWSAIPSDETVTARFSGISHKEGELPTPKLVSGGVWQGKKLEDYYQFIVNYVVVGGEYDGMEVPVFLRYNFGPANEDGKEVVAYTHDGPNATHTPFLRKNMDALGVWNRGPMAYDDNILPKIQKRAMAEAEKGCLVLLSIIEGTVKNVRSKVADDDFDDEGEEPQAEKAAAPVPADLKVEADPDEDDDSDSEPAAANAAEDEIPWD